MDTSFQELGINNKIISGLKAQGINTPTDIQVEVIPMAMKKKDIIGQSQTGSGKTLAYVIPLFENTDITKREMQSIILAPTHELVIQIDNVIKSLSEASGISITSIPIIGEVNINRQIEKLRVKPHIIVGTPGRIYELIKMRKITAHTVKTIIIDEGDRLLDINNLSKVKDIIKTTLRERQLMVFSATIDDKTLAITNDIMKDPEIIKIEDTININPNIKHIFILSEQREKVDVLRKLIAALKPKKSIVFINRPEEIQLTTLKLQYHNLKAYGIFGDASKEERKNALEALRNEKIQLLISSDISARGLDVNNVTHIFNLDLPENSTEYLHRSGRTGRMDKSGIVVSIISPKEFSTIKKYSKDLRINIEEKQLYEGRIVEPYIKRQTSKRNTVSKFKKQLSDKSPLNSSNKVDKGYTGRSDKFKNK